MPRYKRSLSTFYPRDREPHGNTRPRQTILHEGPAIPFGRPSEGPQAQALVINPLPRGEPKPYGRGSSRAAVAAARNPLACKAALLSEVVSCTSAGPIESRKKLWLRLSEEACFAAPFPLTPSHIHTVMGALKLAGYRSAAQYLEVAKQHHISEGHAWSEQLHQAYQAAKRSCQRGLGPAKQAQALPLDKVADFQSPLPVAASGPTHPGRSTVIASWWMLREIEASRSKVEHLSFNHADRTVTWLLPSSKTDFVALGASRRHACACSAMDRALCPYHCLLAQVEGKPPTSPVFTDANGCPPSKSGWSDTFQCLAAYLGLAVTHRNGARAFTGHSARATGAQFMAVKGIELWRIQIFGRWGSAIVLQYLRNAPVEQLGQLAVEAGHLDRLQRVRRELEQLLERGRDALALPAIAFPSPDWLSDCEASSEHASSGPPPNAGDMFVFNQSQGGKVHICATDLSDPRHALHPRHWRTKCSWPFATDNTLFAWVPLDHPGKKCKRCFRGQDAMSASSSSSSSSSSPSAASVSDDAP